MHIEFYFHTQPIDDSHSIVAIADGATDNSNVLDYCVVHTDDAAEFVKMFNPTFKGGTVKELFDRAIQNNQIARRIF